MSLEDYGWCAFYEDSLKVLRREVHEGLDPGRVLLASGGAFRIAAESGELLAQLSGRFRHRSSSLPAVGDWVAFHSETSRIHSVLERRTKLSRKAPGKKTAEQVVAANVDRVAVVMGLDSDFNPRRLERFLATIWESGAEPIVLLTKLDLCPEPAEEDPRGRGGVARREGAGPELSRRKRSRGGTVAVSSEGNVGSRGLVGSWEVDTHQSADGTGSSANERRARGRRAGPSHDHPPGALRPPGRRTPHRQPGRTGDSALRG